MSYLGLTRERCREESTPYDTRYRPIIRRDTKRQRTITLSDDEDDYPYSRNQKPSSSSRALAVREPPSQLERYNIWSDRRSKDFEEEDEKWRYERTRNTYKPSHRYISDPEEEGKEDAEDREYKLNLQATFSRPKLSSSSYFSPTSFLRTKKEKRFDEDRETLEHSRSKEYKYKPSFWEVEQEKDEEETWTRSRRRLKRTKTDESTRPLSGWRRDRIVYGSYQ